MEKFSKLVTFFLPVCSWKYVISPIAHFLGHSHRDPVCWPEPDDPHADLRPLSCESGGSFPLWCFCGDWLTPLCSLCPNPSLGRQPDGTVRYPRWWSARVLNLFSKYQPIAEVLFLMFSGFSPCFSFLFSSFLMFSGFLLPSFFVPGQSCLLLTAAGSGQYWTMWDTAICKVH